MSIVRRVKQSMYDWPTPILRTFMYANKRMKSYEVDDAIASFAGDALGENEKKTLKKQIYKDIYRFLITPSEFFLFDFPSLTDKEKANYVGDMERSILLGRIYNSNEAGKVFLSKTKTYELFKPFMKRDLIKVSSEDDYAVFCEFAKAHDRFVLKPEIGEGGRGISIQESPGESERNGFFSCLLQVGPHVIEEMVEQSETMSSVHPESVNTVRFATYANGSGYSVVDCFFKMGKGSSIVDNGASGGIIAAIDPSTGVLTSSGRTETGDLFHNHPDTNVRIKGFQLPDWQGLLKLVGQLAQVLPEQRYVGWDLAHTTAHGWVMIEGNAGGQFLSQIPGRRGIGDAVAQTMGRA